MNYFLIILTYYKSVKEVKMSVEPIKGASVNTNDYLQKNSQKGKDGQPITKDSINSDSVNVNNKGVNINPVPSSVKPDQQNFMPNQNNVKYEKDSLDISNQANNAYKNQNIASNKAENNKNMINDAKNSKSPKDAYVNQESKIYKK